MGPPGALETGPLARPAAATGSRRGGDSLPLELATPSAAGTSAGPSEQPAADNDAPATTTTAATSSDTEHQTVFQRRRKQSQKEYNKARAIAARAAREARREQQQEPEQEEEVEQVQQELEQLEVGAAAATNQPAGEALQQQQQQQQLADSFLSPTKEEDQSLPPKRPHVYTSPTGEPMDCSTTPTSPPPTTSKAFADRLDDAQSDETEPGSPASFLQGSEPSLDLGPSSSAEPMLTTGAAAAPGVAAPADADTLQSGGWHHVYRWLGAAHCSPVCSMA